MSSHSLNLQDVVPVDVDEDLDCLCRCYRNKRASLWKTAAAPIAILFTHPISEFGVQVGRPQC